MQNQRIALSRVLIVAALAACALLAGLAQPAFAAEATTATLPVSWVDAEGAPSTQAAQLLAGQVNVRVIDDYSYALSLTPANADANGRIQAVAYGEDAKPAAASGTSTRTFEAVSYDLSLPLKVTVSLADDALDVVAYATFAAADVRGFDGGWVRVPGTNRYHTGQLVDAAVYPDHAASYVILATGANYADALAASGLAGVLEAPIVLAKRASIPAESKAEIERVANGSTTVVIVGGTNAVSAEVEAQAARLAGVAGTERLAGANRIDTAMRIYERGRQSAEASWGNSCVITNGWGFADALSAGPYAYSNAAPIFGVRNGVLNDAQVKAIKEGGFSHVVIMGGNAAVKADEVRRQLGSDIVYSVFAGANRYQTSTMFATWLIGKSIDVVQPAVPLAPNGVGVATGKNFPDALTAVDLLGPVGAPLLLVADSASAHTPVTAWLTQNEAGIYYGFIFGGTGAVSTSVQNWLESSLPPAA